MDFQCRNHLTLSTLSTLSTLTTFNMFSIPSIPSTTALARRAASVSHDREGIYGAQVIAVMASGAFIEHDLNALIDLALTFIPADCEIARCIADVRRWHREEPIDWRATREKIVEHYGYERYGTNCPIVSNHAIVMLGLLYGEDNFSKALRITCNAAYDTDCNAANVGAILGIKNGLEGIDNSGQDWRGPVADRLVLPTSEGGSCFSDALTESQKLVNVGRKMAGLQPELPKNGARFHFSQPGSVQGFVAHNDSLEVSNPANAGTLEATTTTFFVKGAGGDYNLSGNPSVFPGQTLRASVSSESALEVALLLGRYGAKDELVAEVGPTVSLSGKQSTELEWTLPEFDGNPIAKVGLRVIGASAGDVVLVDSYTWDGEPRATFQSPRANLETPRSDASVWRQAWVNAVDSQISWEQAFYTIIQNHGRGLVSTGTHGWKNYRADARFKLRAAQGGGLAVRYGGLERYYGLMLRQPNQLVLFKRRDGVETVLGEVDFNWEFEPLYDLFIIADGTNLSAGIGDEILIRATDSDKPLLSGGIALLIEEGCLMAEYAKVAPLT